MPAGVVVEVLIASWVLPEPVTDDGVKLALAPVGSPVTAKLVVAANPFWEVMVAV